VLESQNISERLNETVTGLTLGGIAVSLPTPSPDRKFDPLRRMDHIRPSAIRTFLRIQTHHHLKRRRGGASVDPFPHPLSFVSTATKICWL